MSCCAAYTKWCVQQQRTFPLFSRPHIHKAFFWFHQPTHIKTMRNELLSGVHGVVCSNTYHSCWGINPPFLPPTHTHMKPSSGFTNAHKYNYGRELKCFCIVCFLFFHLWFLFFQVCYLFAAQAHVVLRRLSCPFQLLPLFY
jgi:hypothetical protein